MQFIDVERIDGARRRPLVIDSGAPLVMAIDIARHGADQTVIWFRRGMDARSIPPVKLRVSDLMQLSGRIMDLAVDLGPQAVFVDATGMGWGVYDRLKQLGCPGLVAVDFAGRPDRTTRRVPGSRSNSGPTPTRAMPTSGPRYGATCGTG